MQLGELQSQIERFKRPIGVVGPPVALQRFPVSLESVLSRRQMAASGGESNPRQARARRGGFQSFRKHRSGRRYDPRPAFPPDFDLSTSAPYDFDEPYEKPWFLRRWLLLTASFIVLLGLLLPYALRF